MRYFDVLTGVILALAIPSAAFGATCEESFVKKGSPLSGIRFSTEVAVEDLTPPIAISQMRGIAVTKGYTIITEEAEYGSMLIEQPRSGSARPFPIIVTATSEGDASRVKLDAKLPSGMFAGAEGAKTELCSMLSEVQGGPAGIEAAARGKDAVAANAPSVIDALVLSQQISQEAASNAAIIPSRYQGKSYTIKGRVAYVIQDADSYRIAYDIPETTHDLALHLGKFRFLTQISCIVAKGQSAYALSLKKGNSVKLTGQYRDFDEFKHVMWFDGCKPAD
jgi:predicted RNA-binding protein with TRAM domain